MKSFYLFLFLFLCSACSNSGKREVLDEELSKMPILSVSFDSLLSEVKKMSDQDRIASIIKISYRNEEEIDGIQKQKRLLIEVLPLSSGGNRKKILLQLVTIYSNLDRFGVSGAYLEGLKWIEMLEANHSLSQKEEWQVNEMKALLLNERGNQDEFLPIWYKLLKQYREADRPEDVGKCLLTIANHFIMLEDYENALPLYKEAYQLALEHKSIELQQVSGIMLIKYLCGARYYSESLEYYNKIKPEIAFNPSMQNEVVKSYMELNKPDSARIYLAARLLSERGDKIVLNCMMAETYITEELEDSAFVFLDRPMKSYKERAKNYQKKLLEGKLAENYDIATFASKHNQIESKLTELKNIIIKYYPEKENNNKLNAVLFDIFNCEHDLASHCQVEDYMFVPAVAQLERRLKNEQ